jgi:hypothetical protein
MLLAWRGLSLRRRGRFALFAFACVMFAHSQHVMFACFFGALFVAELAVERRRERMIAMLAAVPVVILCMLPWVLAVGISDDPEGRAFSNLNLTSWATLLWRHVRDYGRGGFFPALMIVPWAIAAIRARRGHAAPLLAPFAVAAAFTALMAALSTRPVRAATFAEIRQCVPLLPLFVLMICQGIRWVGRTSLIGAVLLAALCFGTDLLALNFVRERYAEEVVRCSPLPLPFRCLIGDYLWENTHDYDTGHENVINYLAGRSKPGDTVVVSPQMFGDPLMFYLGRRLTFVSVLPPNDGRLVPHVRRRLPAYVTSIVPPDWVVAYSKKALDNARSYLGITDHTSYESFEIDCFWRDTSRPELFWRTFKPVTTYHREQRIFVMRRRGS